MRIEGWLIKEDTEIGMRVLVVDVRPCQKFPSGGCALKIAQSQQTVMLIAGGRETEVSLFLKGQVLKHGYVLVLENDDGYEEFVASGEPVYRR